MLRSKYWMTNLNFKARARQVHYNPGTHVLIGWNNVEVFASLPADRLVMYVGVAAFDCVAYTAHRGLGVPTSLVVSNYCKIVHRFCSAQQHLIQVKALTEFAICTIMRPSSIPA